MGSVPAPCCGFRHGNVLFMPEARKKNSATTGSQLRRGGEEWEIRERRVSGGSSGRVYLRRRRLVTRGYLCRPKLYACHIHLGGNEGRRVECLFLNREIITRASHSQKKVVEVRTAGLRNQKRASTQPLLEILVAVFLPFDESQAPTTTFWVLHF